MKVYCNTTGKHNVEFTYHKVKRITDTFVSVDCGFTYSDFRQIREKDESDIYPEQEQFCGTCDW